MAKQCLFCPRPVDSAEHVWSDWILKDLKPAKEIRIKIHKTTNKWVKNPEVRVKCVCQECNNTWMSALENANEPQIRAMMHGKSIVLKPKHQELLVRWAILKTMVLEAAAKSSFFCEGERAAIMPPSPHLLLHTRAWIGNLSIKGFHAGTTHTWGDIDHIPKAFEGCVATIVVGHLVVQVVIGHVLANFATRFVDIAYKPGPWDVTLLDIWPIFGDVHWPPHSSFMDKPGPYGIGTLVDRWKIGIDIG